MRTSLKLLSAVALLAWSVAARADRLPSLDVLNWIQPGVTTVEEVQKRVGRPERVLKFRDGTGALEYTAREFGDVFVVSIGFGPDGKVRNIIKMGKTTP